MNTQPSFKGLVIALALVLSWMGCGQPVQAQTTGGVPAEPTALMNQALTLLETADHDYEGHRVAAMKELKEVLRALKNSTSGKVKNPLKITPPKVTLPKIAPPKVTPRTGKNKQSARNLPETQAASDAQLQQAQDLLVQAAGGLSDIPLQRLNGAIAQIHTALQLR